MQFTPAQFRQFHEDGYVMVPGAVSRQRIRTARRLINHHLGQAGIPPDELPTYRAQSYCPRIRDTPEITDLFNKTVLFELAESLIGVGQVETVGSGQIGLRFPQAPGTDAAPPSGHLDGIGSGLNGSEKGTYHRGFTALCVVLLQDLPAPDSGNFTVWPGSHRRLSEHLVANGHEILTNGQPPLDYGDNAVQMTGKAGDACFAHCLINHSAARNASADIRYGIIFRVRHVGVGGFAEQGYYELWHEFAGVQEALPEAADS